MNTTVKYVVTAGAVLLVLWIITPTWGRAITGFIFTLFIPGFSLVYLLFSKKELDAVETLALSFGLSICVVVLDGVILDKLWEITVTPIIVTLSLFTVTCLLLGALRRVGHTQ